MLQTQLDSLLPEETPQPDSLLLEETPQLVKDPMVDNLNQVRVLPPNHLVLHKEDHHKALPQVDLLMVRTMVKALPQVDLLMVRTMVKALPQEELVKVMKQEGNLFQQQRLLDQQEVQP